MSSSKSGSRRRKRRSRSSSSSFAVTKKRSLFRTVLETGMGVSIGAFILAGVGWYYFWREVPEDTPVVSEAAESAIEGNIISSDENYEFVRDNGNIVDQISLLSRLSSWPKGALTPIKLDTLSKRLEIAKVILENPELEEANRVTAAKSMISAISLMYGIMFDEQLDSGDQVKNEYLRITSTYLNDKDPIVAREAKLADVKLLVYDNVSDIADTYDTIEREILELIDKNPSDALVFSTVRILAERVKYEDELLGRRLFDAVVGKYKSLPKIDDKLLPRLRSLEGEIAIGKSEIGRLTPEIATSSEFDAYFSRLAPLIDKPDTGVGFVNKIYSVVEYLERLGEFDKAIQVLQKLQESVKTRTDVNAAIQADRMARFGLIRNSQANQVVDFSDNDSEGNPIDVSILKNRPVLLAFYSPNNPRTKNMLSDLNETYSMISNSGLKIITIAVEPPTGVKPDFGFHPDWIRVKNIPPKGPTEPDDELSEIFKRVPVNHVPYFALVDKEGVLRELSVPFEELKTRVEKMTSSAR